MEQFNSANACLSWLQYLHQQCGGAALLGNDQLNKEHVRDMAAIYDIAPVRLRYFAEIPLIGKPGVDLSVEYPLILFRDGNPLHHPAVNQWGEFFYKLESRLQQLNPARADDLVAYLEADTSRDGSGKSAAFVNLSGRLAEILLPELLEWQGMTERLTGIQKIIDKVDGLLVPWHFGFMRSRKELPFRLTLHRYNNDSNLVLNLFRAVRKLELFSFVDTASEKIRDLDSLGLTEYMLDIDIMPDGSIGDTIGIELHPFTAILPGQQRTLVRQDQFRKLTDLLKIWGIADDRLDILPDCLWSMDAPDNTQAPYNMISYLSHMKLKWQKDRFCLAKVYLQLITSEKQWSINETIPGRTVR